MKNWKYAVATLCLVALLLVVALVWRLGIRDPVPEVTSVQEVTFKELPVLVEDEDGNPVEGTTVIAKSLEVRGGFYGWNSETDGESTYTLTIREPFQFNIRWLPFVRTAGTRVLSTCP